MDQDAFRKLLSAPKQNGSNNAPSRGSWLSKAKEEQKKAASSSTDASKPAFKPRKVKKHSDSGYRDRAAERRTGVAGDFAEVESVLETFEKQHANEDKRVVEERRKYLGGDSEHTVLVKGLDFALLEQTKARLAVSSSAQDDEELEEAFRGATSGSPPTLEEGSSSSSRKRTREDIVRELKNKRTKDEASGGAADVPIVDKSIEEAKKGGKFRPIGFKPIGSSNAKAGDGKEVKKKKKRKVEENVIVQGTAPPSTVAGAKKKDEASGSNAVETSYKKPRPPAPEPEPEPPNEDFDIFAGAGEYEGINLGDDDDDSDDDGRPVRREDEDRPSEPHPEDTSKQEAAIGKDEQQQRSDSRPKRGWIDDDEDDLDKPPLAPPQDRSKGNRKDIVTSPTPHPGSSPSEHSPEPETLEKRDAPLTRLAPLASSAVPSIRDILAADSALEAEQKRKARKEKQKNKRSGGEGGGGEKKVSAEAKINRDYQKLKSYTDKKGGGGL